MMQVEHLKKKKLFECCMKTISDPSPDTNIVLLPIKLVLPPKCAAISTSVATIRRKASGDAEATSSAERLVWGGGPLLAL